MSLIDGRACRALELSYTVTVFDYRRRRDERRLQDAQHSNHQ